MKIFIYKKNNLIGKPGGAEKVMCNMANYFADQGHEVTLVTRDTNSGKPFVELNKKVNFLQLKIDFSKIKRGIGKMLASVGLIHKFPSFDRELLVSNILKDTTSNIKPDIIILTGLAELTDFTYKQNTQIPIIVTFHSIPSIYLNTSKRKLKLYKEGLNKVAVCQVLLPSFEKILRSYYNGKIEVIGNVVALQDFKRDYVNSNNTIVYLARIEPNKQQDLLIESFSQIATNYPQWKIEFFGEIHNKKYYQKCLNLVKKYNLEKNIEFKGITKSPIEKLKEASICAFPSKFEGFSLSLTEAMSCGLPCIAFQNCSGVNELIQHSKNGLLAENIDDFAVKLKNLMDDWELHKKIGEAAQESMKDYSPNVIWKKWSSLVNNTVEVI